MFYKLLTYDVLLHSYNYNVTFCKMTNIWFFVTAVIECCSRRKYSKIFGCSCRSWFLNLPYYYILTPLQVFFINVRMIYDLSMWWCFVLCFWLPGRPRHNARASRAVSSARPRCLYFRRLQPTGIVISCKATIKTSHFTHFITTKNYTNCLLRKCWDNQTFLYFNAGIGYLSSG